MGSGCPSSLGQRFPPFKWAALSHLNWPSFKTWSLGSETTVENGRTTKGRQRFGRKTVLKCGSVYKEESTKGSAPCPKARVCTGCLKLRQVVKGVPTYIGQPPPSLLEYPLEYSKHILAIFLHRLGVQLPLATTRLVSTLPHQLPIITIMTNT